jgi:hypothetical protein
MEWFPDLWNTFLLLNLAFNLLSRVSSRNKLGAIRQLSEIHGVLNYPTRETNETNELSILPNSSKFPTPKYPVYLDNCDYPLGPGHA